jgi:hypothetical protein
MCAGGHGVYKDSIDYSVFSGDWLIGRIYERKGFPDDVRFFWSLHGVVLTRPPDIRTDGHTPSLEAAKAEFKRSWVRWWDGRNWARRAKFLHNAFAQSLGIALTRFCKFDDLVCEYFLGKVTAIGKSQRYQGHFESEAHDPDRLRIEFLAF